MNLAVAGSDSPLFMQAQNNLNTYLICSCQLGKSFWDIGHYSNRGSINLNYYGWKVNQNGQLNLQLSLEIVAILQPIPNLLFIILIWILLSIYLIKNQFDLFNKIIFCIFVRRITSIIFCYKLLTVYTFVKIFIIQLFDNLKRAIGSMSEGEHLEQFKSHLNLIKSMTGDKAEEQFYQLMEKSKNTFGDLSLYMGQFYFQYAKFLLQKMEKNIDIFNSNMLPKEQEAGAQQNAINQDILEDDSSVENESKRPKSQNNANFNENDNDNAPKNEDNEQNAQPLITQNSNNDKLQNNHPNNQNNNEVVIEQKKQVPQQAGVNQGQDDDFEVCADNLMCAIKIFQNQRDRLKENGEQKMYSLPQVQKWISRCRSRLGDLYHLSQNYTEAVNVYRQVIQDQQQKQGHESNRGLAQIHYMIANSFLYDNKQGCQKIAIQEFIKSVRILLNHLNLLNVQDNTIYEAPSQQKIKVDRFAYLPKNTDTQQVKQIKQVISCLLDKIEDTHEQISIRAQYEAQKKKTKQEQQQNQFKQVSPNIPVVKLGTFGNRKKKAQELPQQQLKKRNV